MSADLRDFFPAAEYSRFLACNALYFAKGEMTSSINR
jgi:hypothetical protein